MLKKFIDFETTQIKTVDEKGQFEGYLSTFDNVDLERDVIVRGAYSDTLAEWKNRKKYPNMYFNHNRSRPLGVWVDMHEDDHGLRVTGKLATNTTDGRDIYEFLKMRAVEGLSIGYRIKDREYDSNRDIQYLKKIELREGSIVTEPANVLATISTVKQAIESGELEIRELERLLREELGLSQMQAKILLSRGWKGLMNHINKKETEVDELINLIRTDYRNLTGCLNCDDEDVE